MKASASGQGPWRRLYHTIFGFALSRDKHWLHWACCIEQQRHLARAIEVWCQHTRPSFEWELMILFAAALNLASPSGSAGIRTRTGLKSLMLGFSKGVLPNDSVAGGALLDGGNSVVQHSQAAIQLPGSKQGARTIMGRQTPDGKR